MTGGLPCFLSPGGVTQDLGTKGDGRKTKYKVLYEHHISNAGDGDGNVGFE